MRDDIPTLLRDAAADPSHTPDFDALAARGRRQHLAARAGTVLVAVMALVAAGIVLWPDGQPTRGPVISDQPTTPDQTEEPAALPAGWHEIQVGDALLGVPGDWTVETFSEPAVLCPGMNDRPTARVATAGVDEDALCRLLDRRTTTLDVVPLSLVPDGAPGGLAWEPVTVNGHRGERLEEDDGGPVRTYRFPPLDVWLQFGGPEPLGDLDTRILSTLARLGDTTEPAETNLTAPRPVPDDPDPVVRAGAAGTKVDCDGPVHLGGWALDLGGPPKGAADPRAALDAFLDQGLFSLPDSGYEQVASETGRALFTYQADGRPKVAVIVADGTVVDEQVDAPDGWGYEVFATCDPAEYAPTADTGLAQTVWTDPDGNRVPTTTITSYRGAAHCDWQSVTFLELNGQQHLRDPEHLLAGSTVQPYDGDTQLPADASDTGFRRGSDELWLAADGTVAYLVTDSGVEAWPSTTGLVGCR